MQDISTFISNHGPLFLAAGVLILLLFMVEFLRAKRGNFNLNPQQTIQLINHQNAVIIDIRNNELFRKGHIIEAYSISAEEIKKQGKKIERFKNKPIVIVCNAGIESQKIAASLLKSGYNAFSLAGGMRAWLDAQMPVVKESK